jgi:hypothetical protein
MNVGGGGICETRCTLRFTFTFILFRPCMTWLIFYKHSDVLMFVKVYFVFDVTQFKVYTL